MSLPDLLAATVGDEDVVAEVPLGGGDRLAVTPTRTLVYRGDGLLSDESVDEYDHDVERIEVSTGRRKAKITLGYGLDGDETLSVPADRVDDVLHPVLAGVLSASGVTDPGESVVRTFRFSELTLVVTSDRLVKHVGSAVWDPEFEEFHYDDLTGLDFEEGTVATAVVLAHGGRSERFKAPNESARAVRETLSDAVCAYHGVESLEEFRVAAAEDAAADAGNDGSGSTTDFGEGPDPLSASPAADAEAASDDIDGAASPTDESTADEVTAEASDPLDSDPVDAESPVEPSVESATEGADAAGGDPLAADSLADPEDPAATGDDPLSESSVDADATGDPGAPTETAATTDPAAVDPADEVAVDEPAVDEAAANEAGVDESAVDRSTVDAERETAAADDAFDGSPFESAGVEDADLAAEVAALRRTVEAQSERLDRQSELIEQLIEELRRGR